MARAPSDVLDRVCGMRLQEIPDATEVSHAGETYAFCGRFCAERFRKQPERFLGTPLIKLEDIEKTFRTGRVETQVLRGVNLHIWEGDFVAVIGASGSGKSTVLNMIGLLDQPTTGRVLLRGKDSAAASDDERAALRSQMFGFIFQQYHMIPWLTAYENAALPFTFAGKHMDASAIKERFSSLGLGERLTHLPSEMSGGEQQRTAFIRALANDPAVLLGDEPTGNLDSATGEKLLALLRQEHDEKKKTLVIVTHDASIAEKADQIITIKDGRVMRDHRVYEKLYTT